jgi:hypothetical protein
MNQSMTVKYIPRPNRYELYWRMGRCYRGLGQIPKARVSLKLALTMLEESKEQIGPLEAVASSVRLQNEMSQLEMEQATPQPDETPSKGKVKLSLYRHAGANGERKYSSWSFLTSALDGGKLSPRLCFTPGTHWTGGWVGLRAGDTEATGKILCLCW